MNDQPVERQTFVESVRQALGQLHSRSLLEIHPLRSLLAREGTSLPVEELQQALLDAVRELRPMQVGPQTTPQWRRYRYLWLRYVEGVRLEEIADTLGITDRQARRDHREALEAVAASLWSRYRGTPWQPDQPGEGEAPGEETPLLGGEWASADLEAELARLAADQPRGPTPLGEVLEGALATAAPLVERRGLRLDVVVPPDLPPVAVNRLILRQVVMSLLAYLLAHPSREQITLSADSTPTAVRLMVSSVGGDGTRVDPQPLTTAPRLGQEAPSGHEPAPAASLTRRDTGRRDEDEPPLELARRMAERQGGSLAVERGEAGEERVVVYLPSARATTVLVVDDNLDFLRLCRRYLEGSGYRVLTANLAASALRAAHDVRPDVIVLDVLMPRQDGWELLATLKRDDRTREVPVVVCSIFREPDLALGLGAAEFLPKPITRLALLAALERVRAT